MSVYNKRGQFRAFHFYDLTKRFITFACTNAPRNREFPEGEPVPLILFSGKRVSSPETRPSAYYSFLVTILSVRIIFTSLSIAQKSLRLFRVNRIYDPMFWTTSRGFSCKAPAPVYPWQFPGDTIPNSIPVDRPYGKLSWVTNKSSLIEAAFARAKQTKKKRRTQRSY